MLSCVERDSMATTEAYALGALWGVAIKSVVGRGGLEPPASALFRPDPPAYC